MEMKDVMLILAVWILGLLLMSWLRERRPWR